VGKSFRNDAPAMGMLQGMRSAGARGRFRAGEQAGEGGQGRAF